MLEDRCRSTGNSLGTVFQFDLYELTVVTYVCNYVNVSVLVCKIQECSMTYRLLVNSVTSCKPCNTTVDITVLNFQFRLFGWRSRLL